MSLSTEILETLAASPVPCATPDLIVMHATGLSYPRNRVWESLRRLERLGLVARGYAVRGRRRVAVWSCPVAWRGRTV